MGSEKLAVVGSPFWMAPEVLRDEPYNEKVSLGTPRPGSLKNLFLVGRALDHSSPRIYILPAKNRAGTCQLPSQ